MTKNSGNNRFPLLRDIEARRQRKWKLQFRLVLVPCVSVAVISTSLLVWTSAQGSGAPTSKKLKAVPDQTVVVVPSLHGSEIAVPIPNAVGNLKGSSTGGISSHKLHNGGGGAQISRQGNQSDRTDSSGVGGSATLPNPLTSPSQTDATELDGAQSVTTDNWSKKVLTSQDWAVYRRFLSRRGRIAYSCDFSDENFGSFGSVEGGGEVQPSLMTKYGEGDLVFRRTNADRSYGWVPLPLIWTSSPPTIDTDALIFHSTIDFQSPSTLHAPSWVVAIKMRPHRESGMIDGQEVMTEHSGTLVVVGGDSGNASENIVDVRIIHKGDVLWTSVPGQQIQGKWNPKQPFSLGLYLYHSSGKGGTLQQRIAVAIDGDVVTDRAIENWPVDSICIGAGDQATVHYDNIIVWDEASASSNHAN